MALLNPEEVWEMMRLEKELPKIVQEVQDDYNLSAPQGIAAALRQAAWLGMCTAKNWK